MDTLKTLRGKNPTLPLYSVQDPEFTRFGRVVDFNASALLDACRKDVQMPEGGVRYEPDIPALEALPDFANVQRTLRGEGSCQIGCCWGYNNKLNCLEYHRASEHNIAVTDLVVLLAAQQDLNGFTLPAGSITGFLVPAGTTVELYATTLHYAPCQTSQAGFMDVIILPRGTNHPLQNARPAGGDGPLLWAKDKWLIAHPYSKADVDAGAYPGIMGENFQLQY